MSGTPVLPSKVAVISNLYYLTFPFAQLLITNMTSVSTIKFLYLLFRNNHTLHALILFFSFRNSFIYLKKLPSYPLKEIVNNSDITSGITSGATLHNYFLGQTRVIPTNNFISVTAGDMIIHFNRIIISLLYISG